MMNSTRRGFLGLLGMAGVAAALPNIANVAISEEKRIHHIGVYFTAPDAEFLNMSQFQSRYLEPAIAQIAARIDEQVRNHNFLDLPLPHGVEFASFGKLEGLPKARYIRAYDARHDQLIHRVDVAFR